MKHAATMIALAAAAALATTGCSRNPDPNGSAPEYAAADTDRTPALRYLVCVELANQDGRDRRECTAPPPQ